MKLSLFGVGNAGTRIVDQLVEAESTTRRDFTNGNVLTFNTTNLAFDQTTSVPDERQILIGDTHPAVNQPAPSDRNTDMDTNTDGIGVDGDPELGASVATAELPEIRRSLDMIDDTEVDTALLIIGFGGGTGCGVGSVLVEELQSVYENPVYVLGVLPATTESNRRALTAARAVRTVVPLADAVLPVDNEVWRRGTQQITDCYEEINDEIVTRVISLFATGELEPTSVSELRIDPADIRRTLEVGGLASIGYATLELETGPDGWLSRLRGLLGWSIDEQSNPVTDAATIKQLVHRALDSRLTLPCDVSTADRVLLILSGPPSEISRKGFETSRYLLEQETGTVEVLAGDEPLRDATTITATVLLSNVTAVPRIDELQQQAVSYHKEIADTSVEDRHNFLFQDGITDSQSSDSHNVSSDSTTSGD